MTHTVKQHVAALVPWLGVLGLAAVLLGDVGDSLAPLALVLAYWGWVVLLPGVVVHRWLRPGGRSWSGEVAWGAAFGSGAELALRPLGLVAGPWVFWAWPVLVLLVGLGVPAVRARLLSGGLPVPSVRAALGTAVATALALVVLWSTYLRAQLVPRESGNYHHDLFFHVALVRNLQLEVWPSTPQVAGVGLDYHWFANSHLASVGLATGVDAAALTFHLWLVPMVVVTALGVGALDRQCSGVWWTGPAAVWFSTAGFSAVALHPDLPAVVENAVIPLSPSQVFVAPLFLAGLSFLVDLVRGERDVGRYAGVLLLALATSGAKPTAIPLYVAGLLFTVLVQWLRTRRLDRAPAVLAVVVGLVLVASQGSLVGSTSGSGMTLLSTLRFLPVYDELTGDTSALASGGWLLPGQSTSPGPTLVVLLAFALVHVPRLVGLLALTVPSQRADPATSLLAGIVLAAWVPFLLLDHPGLSQAYFMYTAVPAGVVLTLWVVAAAELSWPTAFVAGVVGVAAGAVALAGVDDGAGPWVLVAWQVGLVLMVVVVSVLVDRRSSSAVAGVAVLALAVPLALATLADRHQAISDRADTGPRQGRTFVSGQQIDAARELDRLADPGDVVVTNVHCLPHRPDEGCEARAFWLSALSGQRVLLEGWAYTAQSLAQLDSADVPYAELPSPWPGRLADSDRAVQRPTPSLLDGLYRRGVRWVVADRTASRVSPRLASLTDLRFENDEVSLYRLRRP